MSAASSQTIGALTAVAGSTVRLGTAALTLGDDTDTVFSGVLTGTGGIVKRGTGTLVLSGDSSQFAGTTTVTGGTLEVGDASTPGAILGGSVSVDANGVLRGHGTVAGDVANQGVVMPGGSIGTLTVGGNYAQAAGATLAIEVAPNDGSQLRAGGTATLNGALTIVYDPGTYQARQYTLLSAAHGVSGRFSSVQQARAGGADLGALQSALVYGANEVALVLAAPGDSTSQGTPTIVAPQSTSIYSSLGTTVSMGAQASNAALLERFGAIRGATGTWIVATGARERVGGDGRPAFQAHQYGFLAGLDHPVNDRSAWGIAAGYAHTDIDEDSTGASGAIDTLRAAWYGGRREGPAELSATLGYALDFLSQKRPFGAIGTAQGDHYGHEATAGGQASLPFSLGSGTVTPSIGLRYAYFHGNAFGENGANGQNLLVGTDNVHSLQPSARVTFRESFGSVSRPAAIELRLGYARELLGTGRGLMVTARDGTEFSAPGAGLPRSYLTTGASISLQPTKALTVSLGYDAVVNVSRVSAQTADVKVDYRF
jgi:autotransporter-associated beta strand protein